MEFDCVYSLNTRNKSVGVLRIRRMNEKSIIQANSKTKSKLFQYIFQAPRWVRLAKPVYTKINKKFHGSVPLSMFLQGSYWYSIQLQRNGFITSNPSFVALYSPRFAFYKHQCFPNVFCGKRNHPEEKCWNQNWVLNPDCSSMVVTIMLDPGIVRHGFNLMYKKYQFFNKKFCNFILKWCFRKIKTSF